MIATNNSNGEWIRAYNYIYQANAIIAALQNNSNISPTVAQQLTGEALFHKSFLAFLPDQRVWGCTSSYDNAYILLTIKSPELRSRKYIAQIIQDLKNAQGLLNVNYVDATDTTVTTQRVRPTKASAEAILARAYLYTQQYDSAEFYASLVINNSLYSLCTNLSSLKTQPNGGANSVFSMNSTEAIWQLSTPLPNPQ